MIFFIWQQLLGLDDTCISPKQNTEQPTHLQLSHNEYTHKFNKLLIALTL